MSAHDAIRDAIDARDYEEAEDIREHMRRGVRRESDEGLRCRRCNTPRSIHVRADGYGGENPYYTPTEGLFAGEKCLYLA